jgi:hypothetical protein
VQKCLGISHRVVDRVMRMPCLAQVLEVGERVWPDAPQASDTRSTWEIIAAYLRSSDDSDEVDLLAIDSNGA